ncbi:MAG TPA: hypothetical protein VGE57_00905 [Solimonas sp.]
MNALAISDAVLALVTLVAAIGALAPQPRSAGAVLAAVGGLLLTSAGAIGAVRYGAVESLAVLHRAVSDLAAAAGLPAVVAGLASALMRRPAIAAGAALGLSLLMLLVAFGDTALARMLGALVVLAGAGALAWAVWQRGHRALAALCGVALLPMLVLAGDRSSEGLTRLHYALAAAQALWFTAWWQSRRVAARTTDSEPRFA